MAELAEQVEKLYRLAITVRHQLHGHRLVDSHGGVLDPVDALETLRTVHRAVKLVDDAQLSAVAACRSIPEDVRPTWAAIGAAVGQVAANAHRRFNGLIQRRFNPHVRETLARSSGE